MSASSAGLTDDNLSPTTVTSVLNSSAGCNAFLLMVCASRCVCCASTCSYILRCVAELQRGPAVLQTLNLLSMMAHSHDTVLKDKVPMI